MKKFKNIFPSGFSFKGVCIFIYFRNLGVCFIEKK